MKNKIATAFEQIEKKTQIDSLVGKLTTLCTAANQVGTAKFDSVVGELEYFFENLSETFDYDAQSE